MSSSIVILLGFKISKYTPGTLCLFILVYLYNCFMVRLESQNYNFPEVWPSTFTSSPEECFALTCCAAGSVFGNSAGGHDEQDGGCHFAPRDSTLAFRAARHHPGPAGNHLVLHMGAQPSRRSHTEGWPNRSIPSADVAIILFRAGSLAGIARKRPQNPVFCQKKLMHENLKNSRSFLHQFAPKQESATDPILPW